MTQTSDGHGQGTELSLPEVSGKLKPLVRGLKAHGVIAVWGTSTRRAPSTVAAPQRPKTKHQHVVRANNATPQKQYVLSLISLPPSSLAPEGTNKPSASSGNGRALD